MIPRRGGSTRIGTLGELLWDGVDDDACNWPCKRHDERFIKKQQQQQNMDVINPKLKGWTERASVSRGSDRSGEVDDVKQ